MIQLKILELKLFLQMKQPETTRLEMKQLSMKECHVLHVSRKQKRLFKAQKSAFSILKGAAQRKENVAQSNIDECDSFGLFITNKLKSYTRLTRSKVQHLISNILFSADQGEYEVNCATQPVPQIFRPYTFEYQTPGEQSLGQSVPAQNYYSQSARYVPPSTPSPQTSTHSVRSEGSSCNEYQHQASQVNPTYQGAQYQYQRHSLTAPEKPHEPISPISRPVPPSEPSSNQAQESQDILDEFSDLIS